MKNLKNFINDDMMLNAFLSKFILFYYMCLMFFMIFFFVVWFMRYNFQMKLMYMSYMQSFIANLMKDSVGMLIYFFLFNLLYCIMRYYFNKSKIDWYNFDDKMKSHTEMRPDVLNTWIFKYIFFYLLNFNILLIFVCIVLMTCIFQSSFLVSFFLSLKIMLFCLLMFCIFWMNFFYCYYKFNSLNFK